VTQQRHRDPTGSWGDFVPWVTYWVLIGNTNFAVALGAAFLVALALTVVGWWAERRVHVLRIGGLVVFPVLAFLAAVLGESFVEQWIQPLGNLGLALVVIGGLLLKRPFTLDYSRDAVSPQMAESEGFLYINTVFTRLWAVAFLLAAAVSFIPPIVEGSATMYDGGSPLSIVCYWVIPFTLLGLAAVANIALAKRLGDDSGEEQITGSGLVPAAPGSAAGAGPGLTVADTTGALAAPAILISGLRPGEPVDVQVQLVDGMNRRFRSQATFSDPADTLDIATATPSSGTWDIADAAGPIWSARWDEAAEPDIFIRSWAPQTMAVTVTQAGAGATRTVSRTALDGAAAQIVDVREPGLIGRAFVPAERAPGSPGVVLVGGSEGGFDSLSPDAARLAGRGVVTIVVGLFGAPGLPEHLDRVPLQPIAAGWHWLLGQGADPARTAVFGLSRGAEAVLTAASRIPDWRPAAIIAAAPSSVVWGAEVEGAATGHSSWTCAGGEVECMAMDDVAVSKDLLHQAARSIVTHEPRILHVRSAYEAALTAVPAAAVIPVERIGAPIWLVAAGDDGVWPSEVMAGAIADRRPDGTHVTIVPGAGHLISLPLEPCSSRLVGGLDLGGTAAGNRAAQQALAAAFSEALGITLPT
jgi:dienelactone hydrolase